MSKDEMCEMFRVKAEIFLKHRSARNKGRDLKPDNIRVVFNEAGDLYVVLNMGRVEGPSDWRTMEELENSLSLASVRDTLLDVRMGAKTVEVLDLETKIQGNYIGEDGGWLEVEHRITFKVGPF
jgi:hypothetical protein